MSPNPPIPSTNWIFSMQAGLKALRRVAARDDAGGIDGVRPSALRGRKGKGFRAALLGLAHRKVRAGVWEFKPALQEKVMRGTKTRLRGRPTVADDMVLRATYDAIAGDIWAAIPKTVAGGRPGFRHAEEVRGVAAAMKEVRPGWVLKLDVENAYASTPWTVALDFLESKSPGPNARSLELLRAFHQAQGDRFDGAIIEGLAVSPVLLAAVMGGVVVPVLAAMSQYHRIYFDDSISFYATREEAEAAKDAVERALAAYGLRLHPTKTKISGANLGGWTYLGFTFDMAQPAPAYDRVNDLVSAVAAHVTNGDLGKALYEAEGWANWYCAPLEPDYDSSPFWDADDGIAANTPGTPFPSIVSLAASVVLSGRAVMPGAFGPLLRGWKAVRRLRNWTPEAYW